MTQANEIIESMLALANPEKSKILQGFFKTGPGQYGEGDQFLGIQVPITRQMAKKYQGADLALCLEILRSPWHEIRVLAVLLMMDLYKKNAKNPTLQEEIYWAYWNSSDRINNWDLVDISAQYILGDWLLERDRGILYTKVKSSVLWERRMAVIACFALIKKGEFADIQNLCVELLDDPHDLMHKACGWMLREMGKRGGGLELRSFLRQYGAWMPRTMLRYAIEKFPEQERLAFLSL